MSPRKKKEPAIKNRVKELRTVKASTLRPSPHNWRKHPEEQRSALKGVLAEIGYADALLVRECDDGALELIDGHLRADMTPDMEVPVLVIDVNEAEAKYVLATLDPMAGLADVDEDALRSLLADIDIEDDAVLAMMDEVLNQEDELPGGGGEGGGGAPGLGDVEYRIIIDCDDEKHQVKLLTKFEKEGVECRALMS